MSRLHNSLNRSLLEYIEYYYKDNILVDEYRNTKIFLTP